MGNETDHPIGKKLLQVGPLPAALEEQLNARYVVARWWEMSDKSRDELKGSFAGAVTVSRYGCTREILEMLSTGAVAVVFGVGFDKVDLDYARARGIQVSNTPDVLTDCVADHAFGLLLAVARGIASGDRFIRSGRWLQEKHPATTRVTGKRLGIVGLGRIGMAIAERAAGFRLAVRYHNRSPRKDTALEFAPSLLDLARWSDFLIVATVGGAETRHLIKRDVIDALGPDGLLINIARGSVVDEVALLQALRDQRLGGAALDVFEQEPHASADLCALDRLLMTPHIAAFTQETQEAISDLVLENLASFFKTGSVLTPV